MADFLWLRREFPWLGAGFIPAVDAAAAADFASSLTALGFETITLTCGRDDDLFAALGRDLSFPTYYGGSGWDAVNDCLGDLPLANRFVILWNGSREYAAANPKLFGEACAVLTDWLRGLSVAGAQGVLVLVGTGPAFSSPEAD